MAFTGTFYEGPHTHTTTLADGSKRAVTFDNLMITQEQLLPRLRNASAARRYAQLFASQTFLTKIGSAYGAPGQDLLDQFVATIPEDERYF